MKLLNVQSIVTGMGGPSTSQQEDTVTLHLESDGQLDPPEELAGLEGHLAETQKSAFAAGTLRNLMTQWRSFHRFCKRYNINQWPVSEHVMCLYAQFLAFSFHAAKSIRNYLYGIRTLHFLAKVQPPNLKDPEVRLTLRGISKILAKPVKRAQPLTPDIMMDMFAYLDMSKHRDLVFWAIILTGFFGMLRKSNLIPDKVESFDPVRQLTRQHISFEGDIAVIHVTWAKNIQCMERQMTIPVFKIPGSPLCPVSVLKALLNKKGKPHYPLFGRKNRVVFTYCQFQTRMRQLLKEAGYNQMAFSSHSMHRGSVCFAHRVGVPEGLIKIHGGWLSDAYHDYLDYPLEVRAVVALKMREKILKTKF